MIISHLMQPTGRAMAIAGLLAWLALAPSGVVGDESRISLADASSAAPAATACDPAPAPASQPAEAEAAAPAAWPPGLMMEGLNAIGLGKPMEDLGLRAYGHVQTGMTFLWHGPFSKRTPMPLRVFESRKVNNLRLNQLKLTLDRPVDTSKSFDIGGRFDFLYGTDGKSIHSLGMFDTNQLDHDINYDIPQGYGEMWFKTGPNGQGFDIMFGKWFTTVGAEVFDGPLNYLYSRSILYGFAEPVTHTGLKMAYFFDPLNSVYFAVVRGWDQFKDANKMPTWMAGFTLSGKEQVGGNPRSQLVMNWIVGPEQAGGWEEADNRFLWDIVWTYRFTEKLTQVVNFDWGWEHDFPAALNDENVPHQADAAWYGLSYMLNYVINDYVNTTGRAEWFTDAQGSRTGYRGTFYEFTAGLNITPFPKDRILRNLSIRPEMRVDLSANDAPFAHKCQWTGGFDVIYKF